jgi:hypothetical protein
LRSAWMPAPPPLSDPAMVRAMGRRDGFGTGPAYRRKQICQVENEMTARGRHKPRRLPQLSPCSKLMTCASSSSGGIGHILQNATYDAYMFWFRQICRA